MGIKTSFFLNREGLADALQRPSSWVLIGVNLGLIAGVIAWDWQIFDIVFLYWVENLVIGAINVLKMMAASPDSEPMAELEKRLEQDLDAESVDMNQVRLVKKMVRNASSIFKVFQIPFFVMHYGVFCFVHGVFIFAMFSDGNLSSNGQDAVKASGLLSGTMLFAISLLAASHLFSFSRNFIGAGEYKRTHLAMLMTRPYGRIVALHITIIFGAFLSTAFGSPLALLVVLMVLKTLVDLTMHEAERNKLQGL